MHRCLRLSSAKKPPVNCLSLSRLQDVWVLALLRIGVLLALYFYTTPGSSNGSSRRRQRQQQLTGGPLGPPAVPNHEQVGRAV